MLCTHSLSNVGRDYKATDFAQQQFLRMKVRVRSKGTTVVVDLPQDASLSDLTSSIRQPPTGLLIEE